MRHNAEYITTVEPRTDSRERTKGARMVGERGFSRTACKTAGPRVPLCLKRPTNTKILSAYNNTRYIVGQSLGPSIPQTSDEYKIVSAHNNARYMVTLELVEIF